MKKVIFTFCAAFFLTFAFGQNVISIDSAGNQLKQFYLSQHVDSLWTAGHHVNWETGEADDPNATVDIASHCSAFVASVCKQLNIYILRPPAHETELLANAQFDWLFSDDASDKGWKQIKINVFETAQRLADSGVVVVAVCKNPNPKRSGHIALVIPDKKTINDLNNDGPTLIQAGNTNNNNISTKKGFGHHLKYWPPASQEVVFFYNDNRKK